MGKLNVVCSNCGHHFGKYGIGSEHETTCPQCKARLEIEAHQDELIIRILALKQEKQPDLKPGLQLI